MTLSRPRRVMKKKMNKMVKEISRVGTEPKLSLVNLRSIVTSLYLISSQLLVRPSPRARVNHH